MMNRYSQPYGQQQSGVQNQPMRYQAPPPEAPRPKKEKQSGGPMAMMGGGGGGAEGGGMMSMSDKRSKDEIKRLSSTNEALMAALDDAHQNTPEGNLPETEYPIMPSNTRLQSRGSFADAPADKVAAQNVGMQAAQSPPPQAAPAPQRPPQGMQPNPQQQNFARSNNPAFNVGGGMPDLSALDEAYRRQGMGG